VDLTKRTSNNKLSGRGFLFFLILVCFPTLFCSTIAYAQQGPGDTSSEDRIVQRIKDEVLKAFKEGDFFQQAIDQGVQRFFQKQRDSEEEARAAQDRLAREKVKNVRRVSASRDHIYGNFTAPISLIVYADFECPFCKTFHQTAKNIVNEYNGNVNWVYRHFPLSFHNPGAQKEAEASECVYELGGNDAFWNYADAVYARTSSNGNGFPLTGLAPLVKELGLDAERFQKCLDSQKYEKRVQEDVVEGGQIGITGTPANILLHSQTGDAVMKFGALPIEAFKPDIDKMLK
jgi:protein-disulfide isomerase